MREWEIIVKESILNVIRESMPIEKILRAYMDETVEEEGVEETIEVPDNESEKVKTDSDSAIKPKTDEQHSGSIFARKRNAARNKN